MGTSAAQEAGTGVAGVHYPGRRFDSGACL